MAVLLPSNKGPHGQFDLLVGVKVEGPTADGSTTDGSTTDGSTTDGSEMFHIAMLVKANNEDICLDKAVLAESK